MEYRVLSFFDENHANEELAEAAGEGWTVKEFGMDKYGYYWALLERKAPRNVQVGEVS